MWGRVVAVLALAAGVVAADPTGTDASRAALDLCHRAEAAPPEARAALLDQALAASEKAVATDERDALAHFALFCSLGEKTRLAGLGLGALGGLRRVRQEIDRTLELAPDFADAVAAKGALLLGTPRLLGGDPVEAARVLRRALVLDPDHVSARLDLARALDAHGEREEARAEARRALAVADRRGDAEDVAAARKLLADLGG